MKLNYILAASLTSLFLLKPVYSNETYNSSSKLNTVKLKNAILDEFSQNELNKRRTIDGVYTQNPDSNFLKQTYFSPDFKSLIKKDISSIFRKL